MLLDKSLLTYRSHAMLDESIKPLKEYKELGYLPSNLFEIERVVDWNKRIAGFTEKQKNKYKKAFEKMKEFKALITDTNPQWE